MAMGAKKNPLRVRVGPISFAAGLATLRSNQVEPDTIWRIERLSFEGDTVTSSGNTRARVYIDGHGYKLHIAEQRAPGADVLYWIPNAFSVLPGERVALEWDQAQADTVLEMHMIGYSHDSKDGIIT